MTAKKSAKTTVKATPATKKSATKTERSQLVFKSKSVSVITAIAAVIGLVILGFLLLSSKAAVTIKRAYPFTSFWWQLEVDNGAKITALANDPNPKRHYDFDYEDITAANVSTMHAQGAGVLVTCYFEVGTAAQWRDDYKQFPASAISATDPQGWGDERWIDIMNPTVREIMKKRMDVSRSKGCDGIEPDWLDNYTYSQSEYDSSGKIKVPTLAQQLDYMKFLADEAHARGMMIALKNVPELADDKFANGQIVADVYDWALSEECTFTYKSSCANLKLFIDRNKNVTAVEYNDQVNETTFKNNADFCAKYNSWNYDGILYDRKNGSSPTLTGNYRVVCRTGEGQVLPTNTATIPPTTVTPVPPTATSKPPTTAPPTTTSVPPTVTSAPPTVTSIPPTVTAQPTTSLGTPTFTGFSLNYNWWQGGCSWQSSCSLTISWKPVSGATSYDVIRPGKETVSTTNASFIDTPVNAGYNYTYQVIARNATQSTSSITTTKYVSCFWFFCGVQ